MATWLIILLAGVGLAIAVVILLGLWADYCSRKRGDYAPGDTFDPYTGTTRLSKREAWTNADNTLLHFWAKRAEKRSKSLAVDDAAKHHWAELKLANDILF